MVVQCEVRSCTYNSRKSGKSFHRFPKNPVLRAVWISATGRRRLKSNRDSRLCSDHFRPSDYVQGKKQPTLKPGSIPRLKLGNKDVQMSQVQLGERKETEQGE